MADLVSTVRETMERYRMVSLRDTILVAVSGGPDSVCMLHILLSLREQMGFGVKIAHLDHQFRGEESRRDAEFVMELAERFSREIQDFPEKTNLGCESVQGRVWPGNRQFVTTAN